MNNETKYARRWLKKHAGKQVFWVEQGAGGTVGFPDALLAVDGRLVPIELKHGDVVDGWWKPKLRPSQIAVARQMTGARITGFVLVANEHGVWATQINIVLVCIAQDRHVAVREINSLSDLEQLIFEWS